MARTYPFDHHDPAYVTGHRKVHAEMRALCPVVHTPAHGGFFVLTDYATVSAVARDDRRFTSAISLLIPPGEVDRLIPLQVDPPDLAVYRLALMPLLTPEAVAAMRPAIEDDARACVAAMLAKGDAEVIEDLALPVPGRTTMRLLGLSPDRWQVFARPIKAATFAHPATAEYARAEADIRAFGKIIAAEVDVRSTDPPDDGIGRLIAFRRDDRRFTRAEVIDLVRMLIFGGLDTVTGAIGNIAAHLATTHALQADLRARPDLIPSAIEEFLRYDPPIPGFARRTTCPVNLGEIAIAEGEILWLNWAAANQDPAQFPDPDRIDLARDPNRHLTFGIGGHLCSGARLARAELAAMLGALLEATDKITLAPGGVVQPRTIGQLIGKMAVHLRMVGKGAH